jgi:hypothetical protein
MDVRVTEPAPPPGGGALPEKGWGHEHGIVHSEAQLPCQHDAAEFHGSASVALAGAAFGFKYRPITVQLDNAATVEQPK